MLLEANRKNQNKSIYQCDRCKKVIDVRQKVTLYNQGYLENPRKYCDLCLRCFKALERRIKKGKENEY